MDMEGWICLVLVDIMEVREVPEVASAAGAVLVVLAVSAAGEGLVALAVPEGIMAALADTGPLRPVGARAWALDPMADAAVAAAVV